MTVDPSKGPAGLRLDKWLWAARFFKTRQLASEAINGGHVHFHGQRTKPGRVVKPGDRLTITRGPSSWEIEVLVIPKQRRPASEAVNFYRESETSQRRREQLGEQLRIERLANPVLDPGRPNKKQRRQIHRFTGKV